MIVKVLGTGCTKCKTLEQRLINLKTEHQLDFELEKVSQLDEIVAFGVMMTPGLVIDEQVKSTGKIPKDDEILRWIRKVQK